MELFDECFPVLQSSDRLQLEKIECWPTAGLPVGCIRLCLIHVPCHLDVDARVLDLLPLTTFVPDHSQHASHHGTAVSPMDSDVRIMC
ncbi:hypothetical protein D9M71_640190 [compost metagenome]